MRLGNKNDEQKKKVVGQLRRTQLITTFGSGAIVDMPDYSVIIGATDYWKSNSPVLHEPNLEKILNVEGFKQPYVSENTDGYPQPDIPAFRFPIMHFCPDCGRLMPYWGFGDDDGKKCLRCGKNIVPSRFIAACINGHLEDFPYYWWVHEGDYLKCPSKRGDDLKIEFSDTSGGLDSIVITCSACGKSRTMAGSMGRDALRGYHCSGRRPWIGYRNEYNDPISCEAPMRTLQRGASNVYFPITASALTIPPWSSQIQQAIEKCWDNLVAVLASNPAEPILNGIISFQFKSLFDRGICTVDELRMEIMRRYGDGQKKEYTKQNLLEEEYRVFCADDQDDYQFKTAHAEVPSFLRKHIDDIVLVKRLREVLALRGFRRISPDQPTQDDDKFKGYHQEQDFVPLSNVPQSWLPAIEMLGEGIFIKVNETQLQSWEARNSMWYTEMGRRLSRSIIGCENFSARYVLLHTLAHLLIRQLSIECGYSGASIKEKIYSTFPGSSQGMSGILLYTSSSDSDGSLGGLVRKGLPESFEQIFRSMLQESSWCSSDPICVQSKAQGYDSLNYAACHACTLLPETSCEMRNCLLDRVSVIGTLDDRTRGLFGDLLNK